MLDPGRCFLSRIYVLRHAQAQSGLKDHSRELTQYGKLQAQLMGQWLKLNLHNLDLAIVSSSRRTGQTFDGLELNITSIVEDRAYNAGSDQLVELIREHGKDHESVMIVGHNPGVTELVSLAGYPQALSPCTCVILEFAEAVADFDPATANVELWHQARP